MVLLLTIFEKIEDAESIQGVLPESALSLRTLFSISSEEEIETAFNILKKTAKIEFAKR